MTDPERYMRPNESFKDFLVRSKNFTQHDPTDNGELHIGELLYFPRSDRVAHGLPGTSAVLGETPPFEKLWTWDQAQAYRDMSLGGKILNHLGLRPV